MNMNMNMNMTKNYPRANKSRWKLDLSNSFFSFSPFSSPRFMVQKFQRLIFVLITKP